MNCYGFIRYLLQQMAPKAFDEVDRFMMRQEKSLRSADGIPCPFHYAQFFSSLTEHPNPFWQRIENLQEIQPGDLIAYLPHHFVLPSTFDFNTGANVIGRHLMLVENTLSIEPDKISLSILDCTKFPHCKEDSRNKGGIGRSPLAIYPEENGVILQWGERKKRWEKVLFVGRLK